MKMRKARFKSWTLNSESQPTASPNDTGYHIEWANTHHVESHRTCRSSSRTFLQQMREARHYLVRGTATGTIRRQQENAHVGDTRTGKCGWGETDPQKSACLLEITEEEWPWIHERGALRGLCGSQRCVKNRTRQTRPSYKSVWEGGTNKRRTPRCNRRTHCYTQKLSLRVT